MRTSTILFGALAVLVLAAPVKAELVFDTNSGQGREAAGTAFMNGLYEGYTALSDERVQVMDVIDGEHFNHKARRAAKRSSVMPDHVQDRRLLEADVPAFVSARKRLYDAWDRGGRHLAPQAAAKAQVSYDCWIEASEGTNPAVGLSSMSQGRLDDAARCKSAFEEAMAEVEAVATLKPTPAEKMKPAMAAAPAPAPAPAPEAPKPFIVFFDFASAQLNAAGSRVIDDAVETGERLGIVEYALTGHADRSGAEAFNLQLSLQRANAVRDALVQRGVKASGISVAGRGEAENAVPTADGVRERANRRVEIVLL